MSQVAVDCGGPRDNLIYLNKRTGRYAFTLATGALLLAICFWMITQGTGTLLRHHGFDAFYDGQAESMVHGHWDVAPEAIMGEAFIVHGKYYGYFGFTPAIPRILLNWLFPSAYGEWTRLLMLFWIVCAMAAILAFMKEFEVPYSPFLLLVAVMGSTLFFLTSYAMVYHEAIVTGSAVALWAYYFYWRYLREPRIGFLLAACLLSFLAFFARLTVGAGPLLAGFLICLFAPVRRSAKAVIVLSLGLTALSYAWINHAKFGTWLNPAPYEFNVQYSAARLAPIQGSLTHLSNIPFDAGAYFGLNRMHFTKGFPWFAFATDGPGPESFARIDLVESYSSIPDAMPALAILSVIGIGFAIKGRYREALPLIAAAFAAGSLLLTFSALTFRYVHDYYPFLLISAILGAGAIDLIASKPARWTIKSLVIVASVWSIAVCCAFTLRAQRQDFWPEPGPQAEFQHMRGRVNSLLPFVSTEPLHYNIGDKLENFRKGQTLMVSNPASTYRYDGERWSYVSGTPLHVFRMRVKFPNAEANARMPLWFEGQHGASDTVFIVYIRPALIMFCNDHWGTGGTCGPAQEIQPGREYRLEIDAERLNFHLTVLLDGKPVFDTPMQFHRWQNQNALFGKSLAPTVHGTDFTGEITPEP